jgi:hypothetical protein
LFNRLVHLELRQAFDLFDADSSGGITVNELKQALGAMGVNMTDQEARQMFSAIDVDSKHNNFHKLLIIDLFFSLDNGLLFSIEEQLGFISFSSLRSN